jgi:hypothetical protein
MDSEGSNAKRGSILGMAVTGVRNFLAVSFPIDRFDLIDPIFQRLMTYHAQNLCAYLYPIIRLLIAIYMSLSAFPYLCRLFFIVN